MFKTKLHLLLLIAVVFSLNVLAQSDAEKQGKEIYDKYQAAIGGKENLEKIKTIETISESERMGAKFKITRIEDKVNKKSYSVTEGGVEGKQENGFDGQRSWSKSSFFRGYRDSARISTDSLSFAKLPNEKVEGKEYLVLKGVSKDGNINVKDYYDPETFLLFQRVSQLQVSGMSINQTNVFSDYRKVGDILVAFKETTQTPQGSFVTQKISVRHNIEVDPKIFEFNEDDKKEEKKTSAVPPTVKEPKMLTADSSTVYKDEDGKLITREEFFQKRNSGGYQMEQPDVVNGKITAMRLKKGAAETAIGTTPPDFTGTLLDDSSIQLSQLKGKVVVLNFWFVACAPCIKEVPELNELVKKYDGKEVEFLSITFDPKDAATEFVNKYKFKYKHIINAQDIIGSYKVTSFPTHIVIDRDGIIKFTQFGYQTGIIQNLVKTIDAALATEKTSWDKNNPTATVPENIKKETLEKVWKTISDTHFDRTFNGVDWNAVKTAYELQLSNVKTNQDLTDLMNKMVGELKQSHLKIHPADTVSVNGAPINAPKSGSIGIETRLLNNSDLAVINVRKDSPADKAGIKKGYLIKKVDGETVEEIIQKQKAKGGFQLRNELVSMRAVRDKLSGTLDKKVSVTFLDENDAEKTLEIERQSPEARDLIFESKELGQDVGYIKFNIFFGDLPKKFEESITQMQNKKAIIVDLRGNPGGVGNHTTAIAAMVDSEKRSLGVSQYRYNKQEFAYEGNEKSFKGKVFILIDETSGSSAEVLAGGLQANKRATIIGRNSAGAVLPSIMELLPNGAALQYAIADFKTPDGKILEGRGVAPDVEVKLTRQDLLAGKDPVIEKALALAKE